MRRFSASDIVLKVVGLLLVTAAVLKGHELLTVPLANKDLWSWRPFLIFQVEFELALGIWLLSGLFKRLAWLAALTCFGLFSAVTLYKGLIGAASCGCFGTVHVNPWITLLAIDLPSLGALILFRPAQQQSEGFRRYRLRRAAATAMFLLIGPAGIIGMSNRGTANLNADGDIIGDSTFVVLEPEEWIGRRFPLLRYIEVNKVLSDGLWMVVMYNSYCPHCRNTMPQYEGTALARTIGIGNRSVALVELPPYAPPRWDPVSACTKCTRGRLSSKAEWFVHTPIEVWLNDGMVSRIVKK